MKDLVTVFALTAHASTHPARSYRMAAAETAAAEMGMETVTAAEMAAETAVVLLGELVPEELVVFMLAQVPEELLVV